MPRRPTQAQLFEELLSTYEQRVADAFRAAVADLNAGADLAAVIRALEAHDLVGAVAALHLDPAAYGPLYDAIQASYIAGGNAGLAVLPALKDLTGAALVVRFDARNFRAEQWLRENAAGMVTRIVDDQREAVRTALVRGMETGTNPRTVALDIVGRVNKATGAREGGILGLSTQQEAFVQSAREELASNEPAALRKYLGRTRRDKRFDRTIAKAIRDEQPVPADVARKAIAAYNRRLIQLRGETIGRTEALRSLNAANHEALLQAVDGGLDPATIRRTWRSAGDLRVRDTHIVLNGDTVGLNEPFRSPSGARLMFPGDPSAPAAETLNCRCLVSTRIDFLANL